MADLTVNDLALRYGANEILRGVSVRVPPGKVAALLGPSAADVAAPPPADRASARSTATTTALPRRLLGSLPLI